jgi:hypothetical protein
MKKIFSSLICLGLLSSNFAFAQLFEDSLASQLDKNLKIKKQEKTIIEDDFVLRTLPNDLSIKKVENQQIVDEFALKNLNQNLKIQKVKLETIEDSLASKIDKNKVKKVALNKAPINFAEGTIKVYPKKYYTTRTKLFEGDYIDFVLAQDVKLNNVLYKKGTNVKARVETLSQNGAYGVPADLIVGSFTLGDNVLGGQISKKGANRSLWVYPTSYVLMPMFFMGLLILPIRGGHAKLYPNKIYEIDI